MPSEDSTARQAQVRAHVALLDRAETGQLDGLQCPVCRQPSVSVWFKDWERTLFKCSNCDFDSLAINACKPNYYTADRDLAVNKGLVATSGD